MDAKIIPFKTKEQRMAEMRFRHLSDHLLNNPCNTCIDMGSQYCRNECPTTIRKAIVKNIIDNDKSF